MRHRYRTRHRAKRSLVWFWSILVVGCLATAVALTVMGPAHAPDSAPAAELPAQPGRTDRAAADEHMARCLTATRDPSLCDRLATALDPSTEITAPGPAAADIAPAPPSVEPDPAPPQKIEAAPLPPQTEATDQSAASPEPSPAPPRR